jgi:hypothetical protein
MMRGRMGGMISSAVTAVALLYATDTQSLPHWVSIVEVRLIPCMTKRSFGCEKRSLLAGRADVLARFELSSKATEA